MKCPKCQTHNLSESKFCRECAAPLPLDANDRISFTRTMEMPADELSRGMIFTSRYEIIEELGQGGMGRVYRAHDTKLNEEIALKLIKPEIAADKRTIERFHNEIKIARKISHKNVCRTHDLHEEGRTLYLTMEYVRGEDLKSLIVRTHALTVGTSLSIARQITEGLAEAHKLGIVHRDLKPGNVMIDKEGQAKIMDFGVARALREKGITGAGAIVGTPEYMSPEQVEGRPADGRADIYSLGIILFEMVTGRVPFEGETAFSIAAKQKNEPPPAPRKLVPQIPESLNKLILRCLEKDREKRYQTAEEMIAGLAAVEEAMPTTERIAPKLKTITRREITVKLQPRKLLLLVGAVLFLAAVLLIWHPWSREGGPPVFTSDRPSIAILNLANRTGQKDLDQYRDVLSTMISDDLSQSKYIYVVPSDQISSILTRLGLLEAETFTTENLRAVGRLGVVRYLASGYYTRAGERFLVRLTIQEAESGRVIGTEEVQGSGLESFFAMADDLTLKIKPLLEMTAVEVANDIDSPLERVTTSSVEAYRYYLLGTKLGNAQKFQEGIEMLEKAVAIDPNFALAFSQIGKYQSNSNIVEFRKTLNRALEIADLSGGLSPRERLLIESGAHADNEGRLKPLLRLIELYPEDWMANAQLGWFYHGRMGDLKKAADYYEVCIAKKYDNVTVYSNLAVAYCGMGEYEKAEKLLRDYIKDFPGNFGLASAHRSLVSVFMVEAKYKLSLAEANKALRLDPSASNEIDQMKGTVFHLQGDFEKAEAEFGKLLLEKEVSSQFSALQSLARLYRTRGMFRKAEETLRRGSDLAEKSSRPQNLETFKRALISLHLSAGDLDAADAGLSELWKQAEEQGRQPGANNDYLRLKSIILSRKKSFEEARTSCAAYVAGFEGETNKAVMGGPFRLQGEIELEMGNIARAIEHLTQAKSLFPNQQPWRESNTNAGLMDPLARAYFLSGDLERARQEYEAITRLTTGRLNYGEIYARSYYMLGQVYEQLGKKKQARVNYRKFLNLWKNADPELPEIEDAKKRLAGLS